MGKHTVKIKSIRFINHDVLRIVTEKPENYTFSPGQATEISINKEGWEEEQRPFTFTSLPGDGYLEFTIKTYPEHKGVTNKLKELKKGDELILHDIFGAITYKGEGTFIAGGAGITPFISIFRNLKSKNKVGGNRLIFANKKEEDIILSEEFSDLLGKNFINILSDEKTEKYAHGFISETFLKKYIKGPDNKIYLCGPPPMMEVVEKILPRLHIDEKDIVKESL